jgi:hypothetical protein
MITPEKKKVEIASKSYELAFSNRAFMAGMFRLKKQGWDISWADLLEVLNSKDLTADEMQAEPFVFSALIFIGINGVKGQAVDFEDVLDSITLDRLGEYVETLTESIGESFDAGESPVELETGADGPDPLAENGSSSDGPLPDTGSNSGLDQTQVPSTTSSGT